MEATGMGQTLSVPTPEQLNAGVAVANAMAPLFDVCEADLDGFESIEVYEFINTSPIPGPHRILETYSPSKFAVVICSSSDAEASGAVIDRCDLTKGLIEALALMRYAGNEDRVYYSWFEVRRGEIVEGVNAYYVSLMSDKQSVNMTLGGRVAETGGGK